MKFDLSLTITGIIALSAIISPIIVAIINNRYQLKLKQFEKYEIDKTQALNNFLGAWGEHFSIFCSKTEQAFLKSLYELLPYYKVDFQLIENIKLRCEQLDQLNVAVDELLTTLIPQIKPTNQSLTKRIFRKIKPSSDHCSSLSSKSQ